MIAIGTDTAFEILRPQDCGPWTCALQALLLRLMGKADLADELEHASRVLLEDMREDDEARRHLEDAKDSDVASARESKARTAEMLKRSEAGFSNVRHRVAAVVRDLEEREARAA